MAQKKTYSEAFKRDAIRLQETSGKSIPTMGFCTLQGDGLVFTAKRRLGDGGSHAFRIDRAEMLKANSY